MSASLEVLDLSTRASRRQRRVTQAAVIVPMLGVVIAIVQLWGRAVGPVDLGLLAGMYSLTVLGIDVGLHRLVTHRAFQTTSALRACLCILGSMAAQGPVLYWVAVHRRHHALSDQPGDPHSPHLEGDGLRGTLRGLWHAHTGWLFRHELPRATTYIPDLIRDRSLRRVSRLYFLWVALGLAIPAVIGGWLYGTGRGALQGLVWGGLVRIFVVQHVTWSINSICHVYGARPFRTVDYSANNAWLALLSFGESWHNNHHAFPYAAVHGFRWWEVDIAGYVIRVLAWTGLAWGLKRPPPVNRSSPNSSGTTPQDRTIREASTTS
jgi:stearoyl-CoA desaturase (delta-9 desaturase)